MKRRWTLAIVITALMVTCMGFSIALADGGYEDGNYHYLPLPDGSAMIERYDGWTASQIVIPDQIGGLFVSEIGPNAFADHEELVSVSLPDTITIIASNAFDRCISIREIVLPDHLTTLGDYAFAGCMTLERINLPDSLKYVSANPFWACEKLKEIRISASHPALEMIGSALCLKPERKLVTYLVSDGTASYTIPEGIEVVGAGAFRDCKKLKSMETPKIWQYEVIFSRSGELLWVKGWDTIFYKPNFNVLDDAKIAAPTQNDATEEQVIATARLNLPELSEYTAKEADSLNVKTYFIYHVAFCMGNAPVWYVQFFDHETMVHEMLLSYDGEVMDSLPKAGMLFYNVQLPEENMGDTLGINFVTSDFWEASVEEKAKLYNEWKPLVDAYLRDHPYLNKNNLLYAATDHVYSVPGDNHITMEQATKIAREAAIALGADEGTFEKRNIEYFFDATDPLTPVWKLVIFYAKVPIEELGENHNLANYRVIIDAETGEVQEAFEVPDDMDLIDWRF